ncbi:hypothetical protein PUN28_017697 [Cardiocondyla obscurior]|uniref:Uncharacterized protein n=1 Tax=Cardiocondyla obscurior TaxID=286306 RepID=A0AAW2EJS1_9HYME
MKRSAGTSLPRPDTFPFSRIHFLRPPTRDRTYVLTPGQGRSAAEPRLRRNSWMSEPLMWPRDTNVHLTCRDIRH